jgi:hypothetical protein
MPMDFDTQTLLTRPRYREQFRDRPHRGASETEAVPVDASRRRADPKRDEIRRIALSDVRLETRDPGWSPRSRSSSISSSSSRFSRIICSDMSSRMLPSSNWSSVPTGFVELMNERLFSNVAWYCFLYASNDAAESLRGPRA